MPVPIAPITGPIVAPAFATPSAGAGGAPGAFQSAFKNAIGEVEQYQQNAQNTVGKFLSGEDEEIQHVALATQQADLSFQFFLQVRNKIVDAYQAVMQMQV
ncbi:MAG: flagellar hook-basal body complex protein FliE [Thermoplasmata archaeon]